MDDQKKFFFLIIRPNHFVLNAINENCELLHKEEYFFNEEDYKDNIDTLKKFLDENIFKIEKKFNLYIQDIYLIIDDNNFINIDITLIKDFKNLFTKIDNNFIDLSNIKNSVLKSNIDFQLVHMIINRFIINKKDYLVIPDQIDKKNLFLEIRFICLRTKAFLNLEKIFLKYQISIKKVLSYEYVNSFKTDKTDYISIVANKLINGLNKNEVNFRKKYPKNIGFFERFFNFFS
tara:strand:- start:141 stop:839 length:699 start_codon:yes stop_codon:yes gene_type:complete